MKSYLNRQTDGSCCKWCTKIAGRYDYGKAPEDIFKRHDNCTCTVTFESGRFRQDVWSKKSWEEAPKGVKIKKPIVLSQEQGQAVQNSIMSQYMGIDKSGGSGIIITGGKISDSNFTKSEIYEKQAEDFYAARIKNNDDVEIISKNTGFSKEEIVAIKKHIMIEEHYFKDGSLRKFDPNIDQALAWQRMMKGNATQNDILLLNHELRELRYIEENNCDYETAHLFSNQKYDWQDAVDSIVDKDEIDSELLK